MGTLNPIIEKFYLSLLDYSGLTLQDNIIVQKNEKLGEFTIDDKFIALPYLEQLKNPEGKSFFHLLNESYTSPETALFNQFKNRLVLELNLRFTSLVTSLIAIGSDVMMQQRIRSTELIDIITSIGETDHSVIEAFLGMVKASTKQNKESYIVDIFLKKNGEIGGTPFAAIGKLNFRLYEEVKRALESPEKDYRVYGTKVRKKDLLTVYNVMLAVFKHIDNKDAYVEGTDNKVFRYLNILLKTSYILSSRLNEIADLMDELKEPSLNVEEIRGNHEWIEPLTQLQGMVTEIRLIPNQTDIGTEARRLVIDESKAAVAPQQQQAPQQQVQPTFNPAMVQQSTPQPTYQPQQQQAPQQQQQPQQPQQMSPEDIIRNRLNGVNTGMPNIQMMQQPNMMGMQMPMQMQQPNMMGMQQGTPAWMQAEMMKAQMQQNQQGQPQQQMVDPNMAYLQQQMLLQQQQQQMLAAQMNPNLAMLQQNLGMQQPNMMQSNGIQLNPMFMQRAGLQV